MKYLKSPFALVLVGYVAITALSLMVLDRPVLQIVVMLALMVGALTIGWRRPAVIAYASLAELMIGGQGHLLAISFGSVVIGIRYILLAVACGLAIVRWRSVGRQWFRYRQFYLPATLLAVWVLLACGWGAIQHYPLGRIFTDGNAFGFLLAWLVWPVLVESDRLQVRHRLMAVILAGICWVAVEGVVFGALFRLNLPVVAHVYHWVRQAGIGEIAPIGKVTWRVFLQSQFYGIVAGLFILASWLKSRWPHWAAAGIAAAVAASLTSLSRSFWLGGLVGLLVLAAGLWVDRRRLGWSGIGRPLIVAIAVGIVWSLWGSYFPYLWPTHGGGALTSRFAGDDALLSAAARRNQIKPLLSEISHNPVFGRGVGAQARYFNPDPRNHGWRETSAFELGYLDWWLKFGLIGLALLAWSMVALGRWMKNVGRFVILAPPLAALLTIHLTTPYLNHPLGLGWIACSILLLTYAD